MGPVLQGCPRCERWGQPPAGMAFTTTPVPLAWSGMEPAALIREYLLLGLRFDRVEEGYVDSFTGDPALRRIVDDEPPPDPAELARHAGRLLTALPDVPCTE